MGLPRQRAATHRGGTFHVSVPPPAEAAGPAASRFPFRAAGRFRRSTCRLRPWRHATRVAWGACRHGSFAISLGRWSFLPFHSSKWSDMSKIPLGELVSVALWSRDPRAQGAVGVGDKPIIGHYHHHHTVHTRLGSWKVTSSALMRRGLPAPAGRRGCRIHGDGCPSSYSLV